MADPDDKKTDKDRNKDRLEGKKTPPEKKSDSKKPSDKKDAGRPKPKDGKKPDPKKDAKAKPQSMVALVSAILNTAKGLSPDGLTMTGEPLEKVEINPPIDTLKVESFTGPVTIRSFQQKNSDGSATLKDPTPPQPPQNSGTAFQNTQKTTINFKRRPGGLASTSGQPTNSYE